MTFKDNKTQLPSSFLKAFLGDTIIYGFADALFKALGILTFPIFAHILTVQEYGVIELALTFSALSAIFYVGIHNAIQRFYWEPNITEQERKQLISTGLSFLVGATCAVSFIFLAILGIFSANLENIYHIEWKYVVISLVTVLPNQIFLFTQCWLRLHFAPWRFMFLSATLNLANLALSLTFLVWLKWGITGFLLGGLIANSLVVPFALWLMRKELAATFDFTILKNIVSFGYPFIFTSIAFWIFATMDRWMIGWLSDVHQVGLYSVAFKLTMILNIVKSAFSQAWSPHALKMYHSSDHYQPIYSRVLTLWFFALTFMGTGLFLFAPEFFQFTTPPEYWDVTPVVIFSVAGLVMNGTTEVTAAGISIKKKTFIFTQGSWISAAVNFILNYLLIPEYGALGAAIATFASYGVLTSFYLYHSQKLNPIPLEKKQLSATLCLLFLSVGMSWWMKDYPLSINLFLVKGLYLSSFVIVAFALNILTTPKKLVAKIVEKPLG